MAGGVLAFLGYACSSLWPPCPTLFSLFLWRKVRELQEILQSLALHRIGEAQTITCVCCAKGALLCLG